MLGSDDLHGIQMVHEELTSRKIARAAGEAATVADIEADLALSLAQVADLLTELRGRRG